MKIELKETILVDGNTVFDVNIFANSNPKFGNKCIVSCTSERAAQAFAENLKQLIERFSTESFEVVD